MGGRRLAASTDDALDPLAAIGITLFASSEQRRTPIQVPATPPGHRA
jgi:hypothetical protein